MQLEVQEKVSLKNFCTYKTGGQAAYYGVAKSIDEMIGLRNFAHEKQIPFMILGGGSNVLFADEGYPGLIIHNRMEAIQFQGETVTAESGLQLMKLLLVAAQQNLGGISGLANVPGTIGGAVYGNAGIPDLWIGNVLTHVLILPSNSDKPTVVAPEYFEFAYRESKIKKTKDIVLSVTMKLKQEPSIKIRAEINQYIKERALKQPAGNSCGSFFKNPNGFPSAGWLIEQAGCKGIMVGDAQISPKHANFIMNKGSATTADILAVASKAHQKVQEKFDIFMEPEVQIIPHNPFQKNNS
ncbi:UDP-N-acetylmuramate dehydrogenase [Candidatus Peregrinibacteria bacterium]|nr:MAG: UDP-N-acetylmuramate dehydrogenase [Candidatus Peregrinibacteria bacterium]